MEKNLAAVALGKARWKGTTAAERKAFASKSAASISPEAASERAKKAQATRKRNAKLRKKEEAKKNISVKLAGKIAVSEK